MKVLDADTLSLSLNEIKKVFIEFSPQILCVSLWTTTFEGELEGARVLKNMME